MADPASDLAGAGSDSGCAALLRRMAEYADCWNQDTAWHEYQAGFECIQELAASSDNAVLQDIAIMLGGFVGALGESNQTPSLGQRELIHTALPLLTTYVRSSFAPDALRALIGHLEDARWIEPLTREDASLLESFSNDPGIDAPIQAANTTPAESDIAEGDQAQISFCAVGDGNAELDPSVREMVELLEGELEHMGASLADTLSVATDDGIDAGARKDAISHYAEQVERLGLAAEVAGLEGLQGLCALLVQNLGVLSQRDSPVTAAEGRLLFDWCTGVHAYLHNLGAEPACRNLSVLIDNAGWPMAADSTQAGHLYALLSTPVTDALKEDVAPRQQTATPDDVSVSIPDDCDAELLDGLLQELPGQTAGFSAAVQSLIGDEASAESMEVAQRVAHTLKGAANTVGVSGIANLTHHLEDILVALGKHQALPGSALGQVLQSAADCLEVMTETLMGQAPPPEDAVDVLQSVLDWANRIDDEGIDSVRARVAPIPAPAADSEPSAIPGEVALQPEAETNNVRTNPDPAPTQWVRVPAALVDDLLRLVGETIILNGQIFERVQRTIAQKKTMQVQFALLQQLGSELEQLIDLHDMSSPRQRRDARSEFDPLELDQYNELHTVSRRLVEAATDAREVGREVDGHLTLLNDMLIEQGRLNRENQEVVLHTRMVPVQNIIPRIHRSVRQAGRAAGKTVELECAGTETLMDSNVISDLVDPLMHLLRNAVDHGIEAAELREESGKDPVGRIRLEFQREGNHVLVRCEDDGAGLDWVKIRESAEAKGLVGTGQALTEAELCQLVLRAGFSTRDVATQLSGRGIGMDAVQSSISGLGGSLSLHSSTGNGCRVEIRLPLTLVSTHALLVRALSQVLAISNRGIEQILHPGAGEPGEIGDSPTYKVGDELYPSIDLSTLLGLKGERRASKRGHSPVLIVSTESGRQAIQVDAVLDSRDLVIKGLGGYVPKLRGIAGATILGDGSVTPVLDLPELLRSTERVRTSGTAESDAQRPVQSSALPSALVVDDSLSARRSLAQFIGDSGFQVRTARDGLEAIELIGAIKPDLLLVDLEMPRMNGLELTSHVRANESTRFIPVIMITSRSTEKHRREATAAGVDRYLTKPYSEDDLMAQVEALCG